MYPNIILTPFIRFAILYTYIHVYMYTVHELCGAMTALSYAKREVLGKYVYIHTQTHTHMHTHTLTLLLPCRITEFFNKTKQYYLLLSVTLHTTCYTLYTTHYTLNTKQHTLHTTH